jgi:hypothetical protein
MVWILVISIAKEYILFALHLCPLCNYYITGCRKLLTILIICQEASHWMLISMLPLVVNLYWKRVFNKQTMTTICYWYIWQEASHWMLISMLPLVGSLYWKRVFNKQTMTAICYWYDKWLNFDMHQMEMMRWSEFCWSLLQRSIYYLLFIFALCVTIISKVAWSFLLSS